MRNAFILVFIIFLTSCQSLYYPQKTNIPLFTQKKQSEIDLSIGNNGFALLSSYSPINNFGTQINLYYINFFKDSLIYGTKEIYLSLGYWNKYKNKFIWEIYTGIGKGVNLYKGDSIKTNSMFVQPNIGWRDENFILGFSTKLNLNNMNLNNQKYIIPAFEPNLLLGLGYKHIYFSVSSGLSFIPIKKTPEIKTLYLSLSCGIKFKF